MDHRQHSHASFRLRLKAQSDGTLGTLWLAACLAAYATHVIYTVIALGAGFVTFGQGFFLLLFIVLFPLGIIFGFYTMGLALGYLLVAAKNALLLTTLGVVVAGKWAWVSACAAVFSPVGL